MEYIYPESDEYLQLLCHNVESGKISDEKFERLIVKLGEWMDNFPLGEETCN